MGRDPAVTLRAVSIARIRSGSAQTGNGAASAGRPKPGHGAGSPWTMHIWDGHPGDGHDVVAAHARTRLTGTPAHSANVAQPADPVDPSRV
jgi:hypothetical protein